MGDRHSDDGSVPEQQRVRVPLIPAPRVSPEAGPVADLAPRPRGWRARRAARAEAAANLAQDVAIARAQRRARQVAMASLPND